MVKSVRYIEQCLWENLECGEKIIIFHTWAYIFLTWPVVECDCEFVWAYAVAKSFLATIINRSILCAVCELRTWLKEMFCLTQQKKRATTTVDLENWASRKKNSELYKTYSKYNICMHEYWVVDSGISSFFKCKLQLCFINFLVSNWF